MDARKRSSEILNQVGAVLLRKRKHEVWALPEGQRFVRASTPSDIRGERNNLSELQSLLDVKPDKRTNPDRQAKRPDHGGNGKRMDGRPIGSPLADALRVSGVVERELRGRMTDLENTVNQLRESNQALKGQRHRCWMCRLRMWWKRENQ